MTEPQQIIATPAMSLPSQVCYNPKVDSFSTWKVKWKVFAETVGISAMFQDESQVDLKIDKKAKMYLILSLDNDSLLLLRDVETSSASNLWKQLTDYYERNSAASLFNLKMQLSREELKPNESVTNLINRINVLSQQRKLFGDPVSDSDLIFYLIKGVGIDKRFESVASMLTMIPNMTYTNACASLQDHELNLPLLKSIAATSDPTAGLVNYVSKSNVCSFCMKSGHDIEKCDYKNKTCFKCHRVGHKAVDCKFNSKDEICNFVG
jgi:hypothetical protein